MRRARHYFETVVLSYQGDDCLLWPFSRDGNGYGKLCFNGSTRMAHRLACIAIHGEPPTPQHQAAHSCGRGKFGCVNPRHVRWATRAENEADKVEHGTANRGERNGQSKLTALSARQIRAMRGQVTQRELAEQFGVTRQIIYYVQTGKRWKHV